MTPKDAGTKKPNILLRLLAFLLTVVLLLAAVAAVFYRDRLSIGALRRWLSYRSITLDETGLTEPFTHGGGDRLDMACIEGGFVFASRAGAHYYAPEGSELSSQILSLDNPVLSTSAKAGVVYDAGGSSLFLFTGQDLAFTYTPDSGGILSARVNDRGWLAVTAQASRYRGGVTVFNASYQPVITLNYSSAFVTDAVVSPDCRTVAVVTISQSGGAFQSQVLLYAVNAQEPFATVTLPGFTVLDMDFDSAGIWLLGQSSLVVLSADGAQRHEYVFSPGYLKGYALEGDGFAALLLGKYRAGSAREAVTVGADGNLLARQELSAQVLSLSAAGDYVALLTSLGLEIFTSQLQPYAILADTLSARHVALYSDASALLADSQQAWLYIPTGNP